MAKRKITADLLHDWYAHGKVTLADIVPLVSATLGRPASESEVKRMLWNELPKEHVYQKKIIAWLKEEYPRAFIRKDTSGIYSEGGFPDILAIIDGKYYGFEVKRPFIGQPSKLQLRTIERIREAGGRAGIVCFPYEAQRIIEESSMGG